MIFEVKAPETRSTLNAEKAPVGGSSRTRKHQKEEATGGGSRRRRRRNLSPLKFQLFKYNLTDNPFCPSCGESVETPIHYFIECNTHRANRQIMIQNLLKLNPNLSSPSDFLDYILNGSISGTNEQRDRTNKAIFRHVSIFMFKTERFILNF